MLFPARLRLLISAFLLVVPVVRSRDESLFTSSVTYCSPPESLLIQQFDVAYFASNRSISFNISAASVEPNLNVTANLFLNVYGMHPINVTINLCNILNGALCPLPMYNFTGSDSIPLPSSLGVTGKIPTIAFKIPDLEAFAQLTLVQVSTGKVKACVQSTLSNGWSTRQTAVEWSMAGFAFLSLLLAIWQCLVPDALAPYRFIDLLFLFQSIAATGFLNINYPSVYRAFTLNFAWAMGLVSVSSSFQNSINNLRHLTGGSMADASGGAAVDLVNRKLSPYNVKDALLHQAPSSLLTRVGLLPRGITVQGPSNSSFAFTQDLPVRGEPATVTQASANILEAGVPIYVNTLHIATANAFMTIFFIILILTAIALIGFVIGFVGLRLMKQRGWGNTEQVMEVNYAYPALVRAWSLRLCLIATTPALIFAFYQWTLHDAWLPVLMSVLFFSAILVILVYPTFLILRLAFRSTSHALSATTAHLSFRGPLYAQYRTPRYYFFLPLLVASFAKALVIAVAQSYGETQVILMTIIEFFVLLLHLVLQPYKYRGGDILASYLAVTRLVASGLMAAFLERLSVDAIPRVVIGIIIAVIFSVSVVVMFLNFTFLVFRAFQALKAPLHHGSVDVVMLEKGLADGRSSRLTNSPVSRTPDPEPLRYPESTEIAHGRRSLSSRESESMTLGPSLPHSPTESLSYSYSHSEQSTSPHPIDFAIPPKSPLSPSAPSISTSSR